MNPQPNAKNPPKRVFLAAVILIFFSSMSALESVGFVNVRWWDHRKTEHADCDDFSQSYYPHMLKASGRLMSLNLEATKQ